MSVTSPELIETRRDEIINVCETLYKTMSFKEINIKEIGKITSFGRTSIYNYFKTKEEIFLALLQREYDAWTEELSKIADKDKMPADKTAEELAHSLEKRVLMLKLLAMNLYDIEENSSFEKLCEFKKSYKVSVKALDSVLEKHCPNMTAEERNSFIYALLPFLFGVYPYCYATEKQCKAMDEIGLAYPTYSIYELVLNFISKLI